MINRRLRYRAAREGLAALGQESTLSYLRDMAKMVFDETGLLPHLNPGLMDAGDLAELRKVSVSMGIMLESGSERLPWKRARRTMVPPTSSPSDAWRRSVLPVKQKFRLRRAF
ncbi:MAG: hypothetical protein U5O39_16450 [Gammaproteobacteria bacterium]|nr:hypothetical protein [Gammaproteobacteria bacterium]